MDDSASSQRLDVALWRQRPRIVPLLSLLALLLLAAVAPRALAQGSPPDAPTAVAAYSVRTTELEVRWSAADTSTTSFKIQWRSGSEEFHASRQLTSDPATSIEIDQSTPAGDRYMDTLSGLTGGAEYTVRVIAANSKGDSDPSARATGTPAAPMHTAHEHPLETTNVRPAGHSSDTADDFLYLASDRTGDGADLAGALTTVDTDTTAPAIDRVAITSTPGTYVAEDEIEVTVTFTEPVVVTGTPELTIEVGDKDRGATYKRGVGAELVFVYQVAAGDSDTNGLSINANSLSLNGGTIRNSDGNDALLDHDEVPTNQNHMVDGIKPALSASVGVVAKGITVILTYSEHLDPDSQPPPGDFVIGVDSTQRPVAAVVMRRNTVRLTLASTVIGGQAMAVSYEPGNNPIRDLAGNPASAFDGRHVSNETRTNILFIVADDLNWDSVGVYGSPVEGATPHLDQLAAEGMWFNRAHVTISVCHPNRSVLLTGRYAHLSGGEGFHPLEIDNVPILSALLREDGYMVGILGKPVHSRGHADFLWDFEITTELGRGRNPDAYNQYAKSFIEYAADNDRPFFLMANSHDPHRPFYGTGRESDYEGDHPALVPSRIFLPEEVVVPGFLPDLPDVRVEIARYYSSVRRLDDTVGRLMDALDEAGVAENTLVMFLSDNAMSAPFAKANVYFNSTRTPWIMRWPAVIPPGSMNTDHFISSIDFLPTILDVVGADIPADVNGTTFLPLLRGEAQAGREQVFTQLYETSSGIQYQMRSVQNAQFGYIFNPWSNGTTGFQSEAKHGQTWKAMQEAAASDPELAARVDLYAHRVPQELYDYENDPDALNNLIDDPDYADELQALRTSLEEWMVQTNDPLKAEFRQFFSSVVITGEANVQYDENGTGVVHTYVATDPEGAPTAWSLLGVDAAHFEASDGGVLSFRSAPDYEDPADADKDNEYELTVVASYRGLEGTLEVTVTVVNVDEPQHIEVVSTNGGVSLDGNNLTVNENYKGWLARFSASDPDMDPDVGFSWIMAGHDHNEMTITGAEILFTLSFGNVPNYEVPTDSNPPYNVYQVVVLAADSNHKTGNFDLTVTVLDVNEPPRISGEASPSIEEEGRLLVDTYTVTDQDDATIVWLPLAGIDSETFRFDDSNGRLEFKVAPDFESAGDTGGDNVYNVTLSASSGGHTTPFNVAVSVTNKEEIGELTFSFPQPQARSVYTAMLSDPDGVKSTTWTWERSTNRGGPWTSVSGAVRELSLSSTYEPVDDDVGYYLRVTVNYTEEQAPTNRNLVPTVGPRSDRIHPGQQPSNLR